MFPFQSFLNERLPIAVVDIGAATMGPGSDAYAALLAYPDTIVTGTVHRAMEWNDARNPSMSNYRELQNCRAGGGDYLVSVLNLGRQALTGVFPRSAGNRARVIPADAQ